MLRFIILGAALVLAGCDADTGNNSRNAINYTFEVNEDSSKSAQLEASSGVGNVESYRLVDAPINGTIDFNADTGVFTYTPNPNYAGPDSFTYEITDSNGYSSQGLVEITVIGANDDPTIDTDENGEIKRSVAEDSQLSSSISATDPDGSAINYQVLNQTSHGTVSMDSDGSFTYTPDSNYNGADSFTVQAKDSDGDTDTATVSISVTPVNDAPSADGPNSISTNEDIATSGNLTGSDIDGDNLSFSLKTQATNGGIQVFADGSYQYTPPANFNGSDSFEFTVSDGSLTDSHIVNLIVSAVDDAPQAINSSIELDEDTSTNGTVSATDIDSSADDITYSILSGASNGLAGVFADGRFSYAPNEHYNGSDSFTFEATDGSGNSSIGTVSITVLSVNDAPTAQNTTHTINEDSSLSAQAAAVDVDHTAAELRYTLESNASDGSATISQSGAITYTPDTNFNGQDTFQYRVTDPEGGTSVATVFVNVTAVNDAPEVFDSAIRIDEDTIGGGGFLFRDIDDHASDITFSLETPPSNGQVSLSSNGSYSYEPNTNYNGEDSFVVKVTDPDGGSDTATATITIDPVDDPAVGFGETYNSDVDEDSQVTDTIVIDDPDTSYTFEISSVQSERSQAGGASITPEGKFTYTPLGDYNGGDGDDTSYDDDQFTVNILFNDVKVGEVYVAIEVHPVNDAPVAEDNYFGLESGAGDLNAQLEAIDIDGDDLIYSLVTDVNGGTLTLNQDGSFTFTPPSDEPEGDYVFTFKATDNANPPLDSEEAQAHIQVVETLGKSTNVRLTSLAGPGTPSTIDPPKDGAPTIGIYFTVHEPTNMIPGQRYPLVLEGHGYGGSRTNAESREGDSFYGLLNKGYGVISITQRGFGRVDFSASGNGGSDTGTIRLFDPNFEGRDLMQILDWAEDNLSWLMYKDSAGNEVTPDHPEANMVLGAIGGSYGGGYQHAIAAIDAKKRIDALAAEITWHDLRYSLFSGNAFKTYWATLLSGLGNGTGAQDPEVNEGLAQGLNTNSLDEGKLDLLYYHSLVSHCPTSRDYQADKPSPYTHAVTKEGAGVNSTIPPTAFDPPDALYWQSARDTLFNMNDMYDSTKCLRDLGADVRALTKVNGHDAGNGEQCLNFERENTIVDWFDEKLKGIENAASYIPKNCFSFGGTDGVVTENFPVGGETFEIASQNVLADTNSFLSTEVDLLTVGPNGAMLAGIPTVSLTLGSPSPVTPPDTGMLTPADPILFLGITVNGSLQMGNQVKPIRGYKQHDVELVGLNVRLSEGDEVKLIIYSGHQFRYPNAGSRAPQPVTLEGSVQLPLIY